MAHVVHGLHAPYQDVLTSYQQAKASLEKKEKEKLKVLLAALLALPQVFLANEACRCPGLITESENSRFCFGYACAKLVLVFQWGRQRGCASSRLHQFLNFRATPYKDVVCANTNFEP